MDLFLPNGQQDVSEIMDASDYYNEAVVDEDEDEEVIEEEILMEEIVEEETEVLLEEEEEILEEEIVQVAEVEEDEESEYADQVVESWNEVIEEEPEDLEAAVSALIGLVYEDDPDVDVESMLRRTRLPELYKYLKRQYWYKIHTNKEEAQRAAAEVNQLQQEKPSELVSVDDMLKGRLEGFIANVQTQRMSNGSHHSYASSCHSEDEDDREKRESHMQNLILNVQNTALFCRKLKKAAQMDNNGYSDKENEEEEGMWNHEHSNNGGHHHVAKYYEKAINNRAHRIGAKEGLQQSPPPPPPSAAQSVVSESSMDDVDDDLEETAAPARRTDTTYKPVLFVDILNYRMSAEAVPIEEGLIDRGDGNLVPKKTTRGWDLHVQWREGESTWVALKDLKNSHPMQVAEFAVGNSLDKQPAFAWWVHQVLEKNNNGEVIGDLMEEDDYQDMEEEVVVEEEEVVVVEEEVIIEYEEEDDSEEGFLVGNTTELIVHPDEELTEDGEDHVDVVEQELLIRDESDVEIVEEELVAQEVSVDESMGKEAAPPINRLNEDTKREKDGTENLSSGEEEEEGNSEEEEVVEDDDDELSSEAEEGDGVDSLSIDDDEGDDLSIDDSIDDDEEEGGDDEEEEDSSSDDSSLGSTIERMEAEAAASGKASPFGFPVRVAPRRSKSMNMLMQLDVGDNANKSLQRGLALDPQQQDSFSNFMTRMNNTPAPAYFQAPKPTQSAAAPSAGHANMGQGVAIFGAAPSSHTNRQMPPKSNSANALTDLRKTENSSTEKDSPNTKFQDLVQKISPEYESNKHWLSDAFWKEYFLPISEQRTKHYTMEATRAMRGEDLETLRRIYYEQQGGSYNCMEACNQQGESLLHLACRRRNADLVHFLVEEAKVRVKVRDDWGKTPLHELCWQSEPRAPAQFKSAQLLIHHAPELLVARDRRGFLPLQYIPKAAWRDWSRFLEKNQEDLEFKMELIDFSRAKDQLRASLKLFQETDGPKQRVLPL